MKVSLDERGKCCAFTLLTDFISPPKYVFNSNYSHGHICHISTFPTFKMVRFKMNYPSYVGFSSLFLY